MWLLHLTPHSHTDKKKKKDIKGFHEEINEIKQKEQTLNLIREEMQVDQRAAYSSQIVRPINTRLMNSLGTREGMLKPLAINQVSKTISQVLQSGLVKLHVRGGSGVRGEENPKPSHERLTRRRFAAQVGHDTCHYDLLHTHLHQLLFQASAPERAVGALLHHKVAAFPVQSLQELGLRRAVDDEVPGPPLLQHAGVGGWLVAVASEDDGDGGAAAEGDGGVEVMEDWGGHGWEVVLHVDYQ